MALTRDSARTYCLEKKGTSVGEPFGEGTWVFKVLDKMFATMNATGDPLQMNLKCEPELALTLRHQYAAVEPGYHMNKTHWNTIIFDGTIPDDEILGMIDHSYNRVVAGLKKADRKKLEEGM